MGVLAATTPKTRLRKHPIPAPASQAFHQRTEIFRLMGSKASHPNSQGLPANLSEPPQQLLEGLLVWGACHHCTRAFKALKHFPEKSGCRRQQFESKVVLPGNENPSVCRRRPFQYQSCVTTERKRKSIRLPETAIPVLKLYYQRTKTHLLAGDGLFGTKASCNSREPKSVWLPDTAGPVQKLYYQRTKIHLVAVDDRSSTKLVLTKREKRPTTKAWKTIRYSPKSHVQAHTRNLDRASNYYTAVIS